MEALPDGPLSYISLGLALTELSAFGATSRRLASILREENDVYGVWRMHACIKLGVDPKTVGLRALMALLPREKRNEPTHRVVSWATILRCHCPDQPLPGALRPHPESAVVTDGVWVENRTASRLRDEDYAVRTHSGFSSMAGDTEVAEDVVAPMLRCVPEPLPGGSTDAPGHPRPHVVLGTVFYFEASILESSRPPRGGFEHPGVMGRVGGEGPPCVSVGLSTSRMSEYGQCGWGKNSVGYHGDDGKVYYNNHECV